MLPDATGQRAVRQPPRLRPLHGLFERLLEGGMIRLVLADRQPRVGSVQHVIDQAPIAGSFRLSRGDNPPKHPRGVNNGS
jgi:hypothetical protein